MKTNWKITYFGRLGIFCIVFKLFNQNIQYYVTKLKENCFLCKSEIEQFSEPLFRSSYNFQGKLVLWPRKDVQNFSKI